MKRYVILIILGGILSLLPYSAQCENKPTDDIINQQDYDLSLDENIATPHVAKKLNHPIKAFQNKQAQYLLGLKHKVETMRNDEVIVATISCDDLFAPNDTLLTSVADDLLNPYLKFMETPGMYKIVIVVHSDDTGSEDYVYSLTESRVNAIYDWYEQHTPNVSALIPYALGDADPLMPNNSRLNRKANRRLEIYLIPGPIMIEQAQRNILH